MIVGVLVFVTLVSLVIGVLYGAVAGYLGGRVDGLMMRIVDVLYSLPFIFFVIILMVMFDRNFILLFVAIGAVEWLTMARIVRGQTLSIRRREFVEAALALGATPVRIVCRHLLPLAAPMLLVQATFGMAGAIVAEGSLSFLGVGAPPPLPSWGAMIDEGRPFLLVAPHLVLFPGLALAVAVLALQLLGDGLRDVLDVRAEASARGVIPP